MRSAKEFRHVNTRKQGENKKATNLLPRQSAN